MGHDFTNRLPAYSQRTRCGLPVAAAIMCAGLAGPAVAQVTENVLLEFDGANGAYPEATLLADTGGPSGSLRALYGTTYTTAFKLAPPKSGKAKWHDATLWTFTNSGSSPDFPSDAGPFAFSKKIKPTTALYGTTEAGGDTKCSGLFGYVGCGVVYSLVGNTLITIYAFTGGADGSDPGYGGVIGDQSGALYTGTLAGGGASSCGTVIKLAPPAKGKTKWTETTLWTFTGGNDGCSSAATLIHKDETLYGVTGEGGTSYNGTVFALSPPQKGQTAWSLTTLYSFAGGSDGSAPYGLVAGKDGVLYGITTYGGAGDGTVFAVTPPPKGQTVWKEQVLWSFTGGADGNRPNPTLAIDTAGSIYGTTQYGGNTAIQCGDSGYNGCGTAFKLTPPGAGQTAWTETTLYSFSGGSDGGVPLAGLTADTSGVLYGTAVYGGGANNEGVVFSLTGTGFVP